MTLSIKVKRGDLPNKIWLDGLPDTVKHNAFSISIEDPDDIAAAMNDEGHPFRKIHEIIFNNRNHKLWGMMPGFYADDECVPIVSTVFLADFTNPDVMRHKGAFISKPPYAAELCAIIQKELKEQIGVDDGCEAVIAYFVAHLVEQQIMSVEEAKDTLKRELDITEEKSSILFDCATQIVHLNPILEEEQMKEGLDRVVSEDGKLSKAQQIRKLCEDFDIGVIIKNSEIPNIRTVELRFSGNSYMHKQVKPMIEERLKPIALPRGNMFRLANTIPKEKELADELGELQTKRWEAQEI